VEPLEAPQAHALAEDLATEFLHAARLKAAFSTILSEQLLAKRRRSIILGHKHLAPAFSWDVAAALFVNALKVVLNTIELLQCALLDFLLGPLLGNGGLGGGCGLHCRSTARRSTGATGGFVFFRQS